MRNNSLCLIHPLRDRLDDGTVVQLVLPLSRTGGHPLYVTEDGAVYSHVLQRDRVTREYGWRYRRLKPSLDTTPGSKFNPNRTQRYLKMRSDYGNILIHIAVALAWVGEQPVDADGKKYECHHLNGITADNRACNLIWLSHDEHREYDRKLKMCQV